MPERDPKAEAEVLARKADHDAKAMQLLAANPEISDEIIGFHAQQAVEKWLKAVLGSRGIEFEYTDDLHRLISEVVKAVGEFPFDTPEVVALTEHAVPRATTRSWIPNRSIVRRWLMWSSGWVVGQPCSSVSPEVRARPDPSGGIEEELRLDPDLFKSPRGRFNSQAMVFQ